MRTNAKYDRSLRVVMWWDAFLSAAAAVLAVVVSPVVAVLGVPRGALAALAVAVLVLAGVLAGCGAITAVLLARRLVAREYLMPPGLRVPLPSAMVPDFPEPSAAVSGAQRPG
jgi:hypothetical protein